jgi:ABC-type glutathione transport system ATPase component
MPVAFHAEQLSTALLKTSTGPRAFLSQINLTLAAGEQVAVVGAPESGKTQLARTLALLQKPSAGRVLLGDLDITRYSAAKLRGVRQRLQFVGGNPAKAVLNTHTVEAVLKEPLEVQRLGTAAERRACAQEAARAFGLNEWLLARPLASLSITLRQTLLIARALMLKPSVLIADEVIQHLEPAAAPPLLARTAALSREGRTAWLWTTTDLALAHQFADRVLRLDNGQLLPA